MAGFLVRAASIRPLLTPTEFYNELVSRTLSANRAVTLAALYLGTGSMERELAEAVVSRAHEVAASSHARTGHLDVVLQMDHSRSLRRTAKPGEHASTAHLLVDMLKSAPRRQDGSSSFRAGLTMMPQLRGLLGQHLLPPRYKEGLGVFHLKAYAFDDSVILSGANLSQDYFTNRQDRYVAFDGCSEFASYVHSTVRAIHCLPGSHTLTSDGRIEVTDANDQEWRAHVQEARGSLERGMATQEQADKQAEPSTQQASQPLILRRSSNGNSASQKSLLDPSAAPEPVASSGMSMSSSHSRAFAESLKYLATTLSAELEPSSTELLARARAGDGPHSYALLRPRFQAGPVGVAIDEAATVALLQKVGPYSSSEGKAGGGDSLHLASGYFNLPSRYKQVLLKGMHPRSQVAILTASPRANGFYEGRGPSQALPTAYSEIERRFYEDCAAAGRLDRDPLHLETTGAAHNDKRGCREGGGGISLFEYTRPGWTFHGKGVWWKQHKPLVSMVTLVGSPNYGQRSLSRDLELNVEVATCDGGLIKRLEDERDAMWGKAQSSGSSTATKTATATSVTAVGSHLPPHLYPGAHVWDPRTSQRTLKGLWNWRRGHWIKPVASFIADTL